MLVNIANAQSELGAEVSILIINDHVELSLLSSLQQKIRVIQLKRKVGTYNPLPLLRLNLILLKIKPDVIHLHRSDLLYFLRVKRLSRAASVTVHDLPTGSVRRVGFRHILFRRSAIKERGNTTLLDRVPKVFAISKAVAIMLREKYSIDSTVVDNGIVTSDFILRSNQGRHNPFRIIQVSRLDHSKKGQDLLIKAAEKLKGEVDITFIGDGDSRLFLEQMVKDQGMQSHVHFLGKQNQAYIASHLCEYDLFIQPSRWEGFGLTVAEAMAAKLPVLVSEGQGPAEVTCGNKFGWTFENGNVENLYEQIKFLMNHYDEATQKAETAYSHVISTYDVSVTARKYLDEYEIFKTNR